MFQYWVGDYDYAFSEAISGQSGALLSMSLPLYYSPSPTTHPPTPLPDHQVYKKCPMPGP